MQNSNSLQPTSVVTPEITNINGKVVTTSVAVANYFQKAHDNVLKKIRSVIDECDPKYHLVNFNEVVREVIGGDGAVRKMPMFELTRDAFALIVMGFTGKKALQWKVDYITAFNLMEQQLLQQRSIIAAPLNGRILSHYTNGVVTRQEIVPDNAYVATLQSFLEIAERARYLVIDADRLNEISLKIK